MNDDDEEVRPQPKWVLERLARQELDDEGVRWLVRRGYVLEESGVALEAAGGDRVLALKVSHRA